MKRNCSILVVEDDADDQFFLTRAFRGAGMEMPIEVAENGNVAVAFLAQAQEKIGCQDASTPCLVVLDLNLPYKTGLEVLKWIREQPAWKALPIIVFTSSSTDCDIANAYELGANSYVVKPANANLLSEFAHHVKGYWLGWNQQPPPQPKSGD